MNEVVSEDGLFSPRGIANDLLSLDRRLMQELQIAKMMARAQKKLYKRDLADGALSITYGLVLIIRSETSTTASSKLKEEMKNFGAISISNGLKNLAPSQDKEEIEGSLKTMYEVAE